MREMLFRGKSKKTGEWVYGDLIHYDKNDYRILPQCQREWDIQEAGVEVIPETIGEYTGQTDTTVDKNKIFEWDYMIFRLGNGKKGCGVVIYQPWGAFEVELINGVVYGFNLIESSEVIGNRFDDLELLKEKKDEKV